MVEPYGVELLPDAGRELGNLQPQTAQRILSKLRWLSEHRSLLAPEPLKGPFRGLFKLRVGDYRALYTIDKPRRAIIVHMIAHRRDIYR